MGGPGAEDVVKLREGERFQEAQTAIGPRSPAAGGPGLEMGSAAAAWCRGLGRGGGVASAGCTSPKGSAQATSVPKRDPAWPRESRRLVLPAAVRVAWVSVLGYGNPARAMEMRIWEICLSQHYGLCVGEPVLS